MGRIPPDPTKEPEFQGVLKNLLSTPPKPHSEMKLGKLKGKKIASLVKKARK
jgi:hypothetical protein